MSYRISKEALKDLDNIWNFTYQNWSSEQADRYYLLIIDEIIFISENFMAGKSAESIRKGYRVSQVKSHLIFYRKADDGVIEIVRILHQRMDTKRQL